MDYIQKWFDKLLSSPVSTMSRSVRARGVCHRHTGPSLWYGGVEISISPNTELEVVDLLKSEASDVAHSSGWFDQIIFGVMDILLTQSISPIRNFKLSIEEIDYSEIESNAMAFRLAAREAAWKVLDALILRPTNQ